MGAAEGPGKPSQEETPALRQMNRNFCFQFVDIDKVESK